LLIIIRKETFYYIDENSLLDLLCISELLTIKALLVKLHIRVVPFLFCEQEGNKENRVEKGNHIFLQQVKSRTGGLYDH